MDGDRPGASDLTAAVDAGRATVPPPVPPDLVRSVESAGGVPVVSGTPGDLSAVFFPPNVAYQLERLESALKEGTSEAESAIDGWVSAVVAPLDDCEREIGGIATAIAGGILARADGEFAAVARLLDRAVSGVRKSFDSPTADLRAAGVDVPHDPGVWLMMLDTSPGEWLPHLVPEIGAVVGVTSDRPGDPPPDADCVKYPYLPECGGSPPAPPPPPLPPLGFVCWNGDLVSDPSLCPPRPPVGPPYPPPPPVPPPPDPTCPATCPPPVVQCPAPPDINITVPPPAVTVVVQPATCPPSPPTAPPPPSPPTAPPPPLPPVPPAPSPPGPLVPGVPDPWVAGTGATTGQVDWKSNEACRTLDDILRSYASPTAPPPPSGSSWLDAARQYLVPIGQGLSSIINLPFNLVTEGLEKVSASLLAAPLTLMQAARDAMPSIMGTIGGASVPNVQAAAILGSKIGAAQFAQANTHFPLTYLFQSEIYQYQAANPQYLPSQAQTDALWVMGQIGDEVWECHTRAHGNIPTWARKYRDTLVGKPTYDDLKRLRLRKQIDEPTWRSLLKLIGWQDPDWATVLWPLATELPSQADLLRMMVRDAADDAVAVKYEYDKDFDKKFTGVIKDWSESQGVPASIFKYDWRAHWVIPSNTQLYEMFHRLRPDRAEVVAWDEAAAAAAAAGGAPPATPRPPVVTLADVQEALEVNDQAPYWVPKQIAISYHPITRTDAVRAYQIGSMDAAQLESVMRDNGYAPSDAKTLRQFYELDASIKNSNQAGVLTVRKIIKLYKDGALGVNDAIDALLPLMGGRFRAGELLNRADTEMEAEQRSLNLSLLRKKFQHGEDMVGGWLNAIAAVTRDNSTAQRLLDKWNMEFRLKSREATALVLCKWLKHNAISIPDYIQRLQNLGYTPLDAQRIAGVCDDEKKQALQKEVERRAKEALAAQEKKKKYEDKLLERACHPPKPCWDGSTPPLPRA